MRAHPPREKSWIGMSGVDSELVDQKMMTAVLGAGYAGTDFIEGFMKKYMPGK